MAKKETRQQKSVAAIVDQDASFDVKEAELVGSYLESSQGADVFQSGSAPYTAGVGLFQLTGKGSKIEHEAVNPAFSVKYMKASYEAAVKKVGAAAFKSNPQQAAVEAAYLAERPKYDYTVTDSKTKLAQALNTAQTELVQAGDKGLGVAGPSGTISKVNLKAEKAAAKRLYAGYTDSKGTVHLGLRGTDLTLALSTIGAETKGKFQPGAVTQFLSSYYGEASEHLKKAVGGKYYTNQGYVSYVGSALEAEKDIGHPDTAFKFETYMPGFAGTGGPTSVEKGADSGAASGLINAVDSVPKLIEWFSKVDNLIKVALIVLGVILITVGLAKLTGTSLPNIVPVPV